MALARGIGLGWRLVMIGALGIADFGTFSLVIAAGALLAGPIEAYYVVRTPRVDDLTFPADRSTRWLLGAGLVLAGAATALIAPLAGLALAKSGTDITFNAAQSAEIRRGDPSTPYRWDAARQLLALAAGTLALVAGSDLVGTTAAYLVGLGLVSVVPSRAILQHRPQAPELNSRTRALVIEAFSGAAYLQGDVLLLGALSSATQVGYYALGTLLISVLGLVTQNFSYTFVPALRAAHGHPDAGPSTGQLRAIALGAGLVTAATAGALATAGAAPALVWTFVVLTLVSPLRAACSIYATVLVVQARDVSRMWVSLTATAIKAVAVLVLCGIGTAGSVGAALAFLLSDAAFTIRSRQLLRADDGGGP